MYDFLFGENFVVFKYMKIVSDMTVINACNHNNKYILNCEFPRAVTVFVLFVCVLPRTRGPKLYLGTLCTASVEIIIMTDVAIFLIGKCKAG